MKLIEHYMNGYSDAAQREKLAAHRAAIFYLKKVATALGMAEGSYEVRSNKGGIAGPGEVTLHGERIYIQIGSSMSDRALVRRCKGRKDYCGERNHYVDVVDNPLAFAARVAVELNG